MKIIDAAITILVNEETTTIELHDKTSGLQFARIQLTPAQFSRALGRGAYTSCQIDVCGLQHLNKNMVIEKLEFPFDSSNVKWEKRQTEASKAVIPFIPEGWEADNYFGSKDSFFEKDGVKYARCTIRKWQ